MGLKGTSALDLITQVEAGLPYRALEKFQSASGLDTQELSDLVRVPLRTLARRRNEGRLPPEEADRLVRASRVFERTADLFEGDAAAATQWLRTPQPGLGNRKPLELASTDIGAREVEDLIGRLEHGVFS